MQQGLRELPVTADDIRYKILLPVVYCGVQDLPDSDGKLLIHTLWMHAYVIMMNMFKTLDVGVTNMWKVQWRKKLEHGFKAYLFRSQ